MFVHFTVIEFILGLGTLIDMGRFYTNRDEITSRRVMLAIFAMFMPRPLFVYLLIDLRRSTNICRVWFLLVALSALSWPRLSTESTILFILQQVIQIWSVLCVTFPATLGMAVRAWNSRGGEAPQRQQSLPNVKPNAVEKENDKLRSTAKQPEDDETMTLEDTQLAQDVYVVGGKLQQKSSWRSDICLVEKQGQRRD